ncbi:MAG: hypothetical protein CVV64_15030 [Candidatus Wallbacteria bacterium HGW-Wallbacteria-1]|jgi:hypothetical protein|uniref:Uncharacterized protein n=1 Tax=Candidatus Wallbacteria bacterium HGW-Wallbacteria-1 TaxID=2013854 RepID=A0A2N1PLU7_9BACT|nr:MAG: hypothetical protein CVV64_15030 [Candidatus Wallbacteria bacterium HGW-Wallbacteria-1]
MKFAVTAILIAVVFLYTSTIVSHPEGMTVLMKDRMVLSFDYVNITDWSVEQIYERKNIAKAIREDRIKDFNDMKLKLTTYSKVREGVDRAREKLQKAMEGVFGEKK